MGMKNHVQRLLRDERENSRDATFGQIETKTADSSAEPTADACGNESALSGVERRALIAHESVIEGGLKKAFDIGQALKAISDAKLYRERYSSFEEYLANRWDFGRSYAYSLIDAAISYNSIVATSSVLPTNEFQVRSLAQLESRLRSKAWQDATEVAKKLGRSAPTGADVKQAVADIKDVQARQKQLLNNEVGQERLDFRLGDPLTLLTEMKPNSIDLLLISDLNCSSSSKAALRLGELLDAATAATKQDHQVLVFSDLFDNRDLIATAEERGYEFGVVLHWDRDAKSKPIPWSSIQSTEDILHFRRGNSQFAEQCGNVIDCDNNFSKLHGRQRPKALIGFLIKTATAPGMLVVDPTAGVATTNIACLQLGRNCIGIELDLDLFTLGLNRLNQLEDQAKQL